MLKDWFHQGTIKEAETKEKAVDNGPGEGSGALDQSVGIEDGEKPHTSNIFQKDH
jgi:hypothetical protein